MTDAKIRITRRRFRQSADLGRPLRGGFEARSCRLNFGVILDQAIHQILWPERLLLCVQARESEREHAEATPA